MEINRIFNDIFFNISNEINYTCNLLNPYIDNNYKKTLSELKYNYDDFMNFIFNIKNKINNVKLMISELNNELNCNMDMKMLFVPKMNSMKDKYKKLIDDYLVITDKIMLHNDKLKNIDIKYCYL
jgi:hypothetical protein